MFFMYYRNKVNILKNTKWHFKEAGWEWTNKAKLIHTKY